MTDQDRIAALERQIAVLTDQLADNRLGLGILLNMMLAERGGSISPRGCCQPRPEVLQ